MCETRNIRTPKKVKKGGLGLKGLEEWYTDTIMKYNWNSHIGFLWVAWINNLLKEGENLFI